MYANETDISLCMRDTLKHMSNVVKVWAGYHMLYKQYLNTYDGILTQFYICVVRSVA